MTILCMSKLEVKTRTEFYIKLYRWWVEKNTQTEEADAKNMEIEGGDTIDRKGMVRLLEVQKLCWMAVPQQLKCQELTLSCQTTYIYISCSEPFKWPNGH